MLLNIYTVYDSKTEAYLPPFYMRNKGEALRAWETTVNDETTNFCKFPADFTLFEVGNFDDTNGNIVTHDAKKSLGLALDYKRKPQTQASLPEAIETQTAN